MSRPRSEKFAARVWREFRSSGRALWSLRLVIALAAIALLADLIANERPYYLVVDGQSYFPVLSEYLAALGVQEPAAIVNADFRQLAAAADTAWTAPIPYSPTRVDLQSAFLGVSSEHWFGTDRLGRDVAAGLIHGTRISLTIGLVVVVIQAVIGIALGAIAGYYGGWVDLLISRFIEMMLGIPTFFLLITVAAVFPPSIYTIMAILGLTGWMGIARYVRSEFFKVRAQDFVESARSLGVSDLRVMMRHILPNALAPVLVAMSFGVASAILAESGLSFLGIGIPAHLVTWGSILSESRSNPFAWWLAVFPGFAIFMTVLAYNLVGDGLRDALDPRTVK